MARIFPARLAPAGRGTTASVHGTRRPAFTENLQRLYPARSGWAPRMRVLLVSLLLVGVAFAAIPTAAATHRICDVTDPVCMTFCLAESARGHPCRVRAPPRPCEIDPIFCL